MKDEQRLDLRQLELLVYVAKDQIERVLNLVEVGRGQQFIQRKVFHEDVVLVDWTRVGQYVASSARLRTNVDGFNESGICQEADCGVEPLGVLQYIQSQHDLVTSELRINPFQSALHAQPEVNFLRGGTRCNIA